MDLKKFMANAMVTGLKILNHVPFIGSRAVQASFEAVRQNWGERSYLWQALQSWWQEIDTLSRMELQRVHMNLIENSAVVQKLRCLFIQFSVGPTGLIVTPNASRMDDDPDKPAAQRKTEKKSVESWNHLRGENWEQGFALCPELNSDITLAQDTIVWAGMLFDRGGFIINLTMGEEKMGLRTRKVPKLQTIDPIRLKTPTTKTTDEATGLPIVDGIVLDATGRPVAYYIAKTDYFNAGTGLINNSAEDFDRIPAYRRGMKSGIIHCFKKRFCAQIREIPEGFSAYNILRDIKDLHQLEMACAKLAGEIATVEKNATGELNTRSNRQIGLKIPSLNSAGNTVQKQAYVDYNVSFGGKKIAMMQGDKLDNFMISRPTVAQQNYWDSLAPRCGK